jgi:hypothetical protein
MRSLRRQTAPSTDSASRPRLLAFRSIHNFRSHGLSRHLPRPMCLYLLVRSTGLALMARSSIRMGRCLLKLAYCCETFSVCTQGPLLITSCYLTHALYYNTAFGLERHSHSRLFIGIRCYVELCLNERRLRGLDFVTA